MALQKKCATISNRPDFDGESSFDTILSALGQGKSVDEAMVEATGKDMNDFQSEFEEWLRNL